MAGEDISSILRTRYGNKYAPALLRGRSIANRTKSDRAILADLEMDGEVGTRLEERQYLKQIEDSVTDLISSLSFMLENITIVVRCYQDFRAQTSSAVVSDLRREMQTDIILKGFEDRKRDLVLFDSQAQALRRKVDSASSLV